MPERKYSAGSGYRYGFNGKEEDNDINGEGNAYDYGARILATRLGRWFSIDPLQKKYPGETPYNFVSGNPLVYNDPDGKDKIIKIYVAANGVYELTSVRVVKDVYAYGQGSDGFFYRSDITETVYIDPTKNTASVSMGRTNTEKYSFRASRKIATFFKDLGNSLSLNTSGSGSYQDYGYVCTGNSNGTMEFKDKAGHVLGQIDVGALLGAFLSAGLDAEGIKEAFNSTNALEAINGFLEAYENFIHAGKTSAIAIKETKKLLADKEAPATESNNSKQGTTGSVKKNAQQKTPSKSKVTKASELKIEPDSIFDRKMTYFKNEKGDTTGMLDEPIKVPNPKKGN